jgi:aspartyl-tRNA(Asn)/glutamyl-tRNA(Gln) amidotransferase subunit B
MGPLKSLLNERATTLAEIDFAPNQMAEVIALVEANKISFSQASQKLFPAFVDAKGGTAAGLAAELNLLMDTNQDALKAAIEAVVAANPEKVAEYRKGKKGLLGMFMGEVMKKSGGKANPKEATALLTELLEG